MVRCSLTVVCCLLPYSRRLWYTWGQPRLTWITELNRWPLPATAASSSSSLSDDVLNMSRRHEAAQTTAPTLTLVKALSQSISAQSASWYLLSGLLQTMCPRLGCSKPDRTKRLHGLACCFLSNVLDNGHSSAVANLHLLPDWGT